MASIKDVAALAGVSVATVSRVLNAHQGVRAGTRTKVLHAVSELGYRPNGVARSLRTHQTRTLGLVIGDILNPFFTELARAVEDAARSRGYSVIIGNADEQPALQDHHIRTLLDRRIDGLLVSPSADSRTAAGGGALQDAVDSGLPVVFVDRWLPEIDVPVVRADGHQAVHQLVAHLHALGHRRLAIITGPGGTSTSTERVDAFRTALRRFGLPLPAEYVAQGDFQTESGRRAAAAFLDLPEPPQVVFATDNLMALGVMTELRARGLRAPQDLALAAFDDIPWFLHTDPPLTAITQPTAELGHLAVRVLTDLAEGRSAGSVTLSARLTARRSCGEDEGSLR